MPHLNGSMICHLTVTVTVISKLLDNALFETLSDRSYYGLSMLYKPTPIVSRSLGDLNHKDLAREIINLGLPINAHELWANGVVTSFNFAKHSLCWLHNLSVPAKQPKTINCSSAVWLFAIHEVAS